MANSSSPLTTDLHRQEKAAPSDILEYGLENSLRLSRLKITPNDGVDLSDETEKKIWRETSNPYVASDDIPTEFLRIINPAQPVFLFRKCLSPTDVHRGQNRLLVTDTDNLRLFLTCDEHRKVNSGENKCIEVIGVDYMGRKFDLRLSAWGGRGEATTSNNTNTTKTKKKMSIVFNGRWSDMLDANEVERNDVVELWGFRRDQSFCLAANFISST